MSTPGKIVRTATVQCAVCTATSTTDVPAAARHFLRRGWYRAHNRVWFCAEHAPKPDPANPGYY